MLVCFFRSHPSLGACLSPQCTCVQSSLHPTLVQTTLATNYRTMKSSFCMLWIVLFTVPLCCLELSSAEPKEVLTPRFRPPAVPLVVNNPYMSVWSVNDHLYDQIPEHWSGPYVCLVGMILIDGKPYRFMANDADLPDNAMAQVDLKVYPTQTIYRFEQDGVQLNLTFSTPAFGVPGELPYLPMSFITYNVSTTDGKNHSVKLYYDNTAEGTVDNTDEKVQWNRVDMNGTEAMRIGSSQQDALNEGSDRINWGYWYVLVDKQDTGLSTSMAYSTTARQAFATGADLPSDDKRQPRACSDDWPVLAVVWDLGTVQDKQLVSKHLTIVYDQVYSIKYFGTAMEPYWRYLYNRSVETLVSKNSYVDIKQMCDQADEQITSKLYSVGGSNYTTIASLAWRQAVGGTITVWNNVTNEVWMFMKEISSDGDVSTVDVLYPASPLFLWWNSTSIQLLMKPILEYSINNTKMYGMDIQYNLAWAPHHLGHWPVCDLAPNRQEQMPVEESGNMLLMIAGSVYLSPDKSVDWLKPYWKLFTIWGDYIVASLPDPGNQLCTDDFEGPSPHNVNLAAKGIVGLGALSYMLRLGGQTTDADKYDQANKAFIQYWLQNGTDGDHYRLQYDLSNTWSLKYNLLFQKILKLDLFPDSVFETELKYYLTKMNDYGIPLDNRSTFTKTDWLMWVAALGSGDQFTEITDAVYNFANTTPDRVPFTDWYFTDTGKRKGFVARPVIGGLFAKMLV